MNNETAKRYLKDLSIHVININHTLKNIRSKTIADFVSIEDKGIVILTNNVASSLDLQKIKKYINGSLVTNTNQISPSRLPQLKSYLKIVGILYLNKHSNLYMLPKDIEKILKSNYIFNNTVLASRPRIIKVFLKSDMAIIWIDIWDTQNGSKAKLIINRHFNVRSFITMVHGINMNPDVPQCKNCWKWGHTAGVCYIQEAKCIKCNSSYLTDHHCHFA